MKVAHRSKSSVDQFDSKCLFLFFSGMQLFGVLHSIQLAGRVTFIAFNWIICIYYRSEVRTSKVQLHVGAARNVTLLWWKGEEHSFESLCTASVRGDSRLKTRVERNGHSAVSC